MDKEEKKINVISMSKETRERLAKIMDELKGKDLFPEQTAHTEKTLRDVKLPI